MKTFSQVVKELPKHLKQYVVEQDYSRYTPIDQATWRFILRQLKNFLKAHAHESYVDGLQKTGISVESIPDIEIMCEKLQKFGWMAVPVSGFIPPAAFMEMQSLSLLPIACDMRSLDHIMYTPAPDIVHEAAGHAPILVNPQFAKYLKDYAQISKKAIISSEDLAQYEAIRDLSDIKEASHSTAAEIAAAEKKLADVNNSITHISEAALLGRMNWWTAEYGLIGEIDRPKIFGAGLLSSLGEASECLSSKVKKIPLSVNCIETSYDITEPQPQLYVAKDFSDLSKVLHHLEDRLAFKVGGAEAMKTAQKAKTVNTIELNSGLQISGKLESYKFDSQDSVFFYKLSGPVQLCEAGQQLSNQGVANHAEGFSSPLGLLKNETICLSEWSPELLKQRKFEVGRTVNLSFASGIELSGEVTAMTFSKKKKLVILGFKNCTAKLDEQILYSPDWGTFDMAVGSQVVSVFAGPADRESYGAQNEDFVKKLIPKKIFTEKELAKQAVYQKIRDMREGRAPCSLILLDGLFIELKEIFPDEWLAFIELLELSCQTSALSPLEKPVRAEIARIQSQFSEKKEYIDLGLELANKMV